MSELDKLRNVIETNFRLNGLHTRELAAQVNTQMTEARMQLSEVARTVDGLSLKMGGLGRTFQVSLDQQATRSEETLDAIRKILDHSVDLHKTFADHERRIRQLEDQAS